MVSLKPHEKIQDLPARAKYLLDFLILDKALISSRTLNRAFKYPQHKDQWQFRTLLDEHISLIVKYYLGVSGVPSAMLTKCRAQDFYFLLKY